jgi:8-oxo-dGTP pyrophosphatase MutT (NUDIX family)
MGVRVSGMSYARHLEACNRFNPSRFLPLFLAERRVGFVRKDNARLLEALPQAFHLSAEAISIVRPDRGPTGLTDAFDEAVDNLVSAGVVGRRGEMFTVADGWRGESLFELDRGMVEFFGVRAYAAHLNGWRPSVDGVDFWIAKRAMSKALAPGKLDNLVAGGIGAGFTARETLIKEAWEEAGISETLASQAVSVGAIRYRREMGTAMRDEVVFVYDLEVPVDIIPDNMDGEVEAFRIMSARDCLALVRETDAFMYDVNLVLIDFAVRHSLIAPEDPDYLFLIQGLSGSLVQGPP